ncbi:MAG: hypothetical protein JW940_14785 [Polyangiaceae bacterium]|nr:hypothetical protein [Polyangiaceae bacterium]
MEAAGGGCTTGAAGDDCARRPAQEAAAAASTTHAALVTILVLDLPSIGFAPPNQSSIAGPSLSHWSYLTTLLQHHQQVADSPGRWLPWDYQQTVAELEAIAA